MTNRIMKLAFACILASVMLAPLAHAQCDLTKLAGTTWTFKVTGEYNSSWNEWGHYARSGKADVDAAIAGSMTFSIKPNAAGTPVGTLSTVDTSMIEGVVYRLEQYNGGAYTVRADCSGGSLIMAGGEGVRNQYDFFFSNAGTSMYLISTTTGGVFSGTAKPQ